MKKLYKFCWNFNRYNPATGIIIADENEIKTQVNNYKGQEIYLGKRKNNTNIIGSLETRDFTEIKTTLDLNELEKTLGPTVRGYNPLSCLIHTCKKCKNKSTVFQYDWYVDNNGNKICEFCLSEKEKSTFHQLFNYT